ncbi:tRNA (adenosine(37)-N6)-threonylcarbamoyltransferase complex ATPase subunit type 1 TsaE [Candidatus Saccharibacteria bacterium]|nr:tRNA (adenosine(37)-N6)-threonylcarbamoyltransferase complex ATPase subunit type 1 TsaE [Candidatus Saccharibacteria bacterium]
MIFKTESELISFAEKIGETLTPPAVFELVGDVGAGKTTFTRALAKGLGVKEPVTSPSFSISNRYFFSKSPKEPSSSVLIHYDFYRLDDPGIMSSELAEALEDKNAIIIIEWGDSIKSLLPPSTKTICFKILDDNSRELIFSKSAKNLEILSASQNSEGQR